MEFPTGDLKPFRIPKRGESPKPTEATKKEMPPLPSVSKRHQIASIDFGTTEKAVNSPRKKHEERHRERKRPSTSAAPLDSIMCEMTREMKKQRREQREPTPEAKPLAPPIDTCGPPVLTKEYLENRKPDVDLVQEFLTRGTLMEYLLGRKMAHGRLEAFPALGFCRMTDAEIAQMKPPADAVFPGTSADVAVKPEPSSHPPPAAIRKGPKTPPGSPGRPHTPPDPPPPLPPTDNQKAFAHLSAVSGLHPQQLEAFFGAEVSKAISTMDQATLLQSIKAAIVNAGQNKAPVKQEQPPPPRRSDESVKMELVSDCSLSPMVGDDEDVLAPPPPPPVIEPPPPPPTLPPLPPPPIWPNMPPSNTSVPPPPIPPSLVPPFPPPTLQQPPPNIRQPPPPPMNSYYPRFPATTTAPLITSKASTDISASSAAEVPVSEPRPPPPPPVAAQPNPPPAASWMADLPSWTDENLGDWSRDWSTDANWNCDTPQTTALAPAAPTTPVTEAPSNEKVTNTLLSALGIGGTPSISTMPSTPKGPCPPPPPPQMTQTPLLDRYGCPLPMPMPHHHHRPPPMRHRPPMRGGRGGPFMGGPPHHMMTPPAMLRYPHMGNSPMPRGGPPRRRGGTGGRAIKLPP